MGLLSIELATKRLQAAHGTQEGIEGISSWMLHHTESIRVLADAWLNLFRTESEERRVVLFYIMNDVVQRAKKKHVDSICSTFEQPVISAVSLARFSDKMRTVMSRCLKLIGECKAFSAGGIEKMNRLIADPNGDADDGNYEIDVLDLARKIEAFMQSVVAITNGMETIKRAPQDLEDLIDTRMKDRREGAVLLKETKTAILRVEKFREAVSVNNKRLYEFVDAIETAKRLFNMQLRDVAVVEDAYVKFGQGVREVQEEVSEMVRTGVYPAGSPPRDAPSPSAEDDVFAAGVEQVLNKMRPHDVTDEADMDVDDDDEPPLSAYQWNLKKPAPAAAAAPIAAARPSLVERAAALAAHMPTLASQMGIDPRARANTVPAAAAAVTTAPPPAKKAAFNPAVLQRLQQQGFAPPTAAAATATQPVSAYPGATSAAPAATPVAAVYNIPPPNFAPSIPPPPPAVLNQYMAMQPGQQQIAAAAAAPLTVQPVATLPPTAAPPPISPYSAPPPGYPTVAPAAAAYYPLQMQQQQQQHMMQQPPRYAPPPMHAAPAAAGYPLQPPAAVAAAHYGGVAAASQQQQQYGTPQQQRPKYSEMPEYGRRNSNPEQPLISPTGGGGQGYYPNQHMHQTPGSSSGGIPAAAAAAAGTPYTPTAPGYRGRKGSDGTVGGTPTRGAYGRGGGQQQYGSYGGYGNQQGEEQGEDAYQPQPYRKESYEGGDGDYRNQQQYQPRGGRGYGRGGGGNNGGGYGRGGGESGGYGGGANNTGYGRGGYQRGGQRGRGYGNQQNYGGGGYGNQGY